MEQVVRCSHLQVQGLRRYLRVTADMNRRTLAFALPLLASACHSDPLPPTLDAGPLDVGVVDTGSAMDIGTVTDTGPAVDRGAPADTGAADAGPADTGATDASTPADVPSCAAPTPLGALTGTAWCDLPLARPNGLTLPDGFCVRRYGNVQSGRVLALAPNDDLFVASPSTDTPGGAPPGLGSVMVVSDDNHDGLADTPRTYFTGVASVHGLLFRNNQLLYTTQNAVSASPYCTGDRAASTPVASHAHVATLTGAVRWTHTLSQDAMGRLYVSMGQYDTNACPVMDPRAGSVLRIGGSEPDQGTLVAAGFRNPMYIRCKEWGACYAAELSGDGWDGIGGHEKLIELHDGDRYGFPCCVDHGVPVPGLTAAGNCLDVPTSLTSFPLHNTPFGFDFAPSSWPAPYGGGLFVAQHGYVGSWVGAGVYWSPVDPATHRPTQSPVVFVNGFGHRAAGGIEQRTADLVFARDGRAFFVDDQSGDLYWIAPTTLRMPAH